MNVPVGKVIPLESFTGDITILLKDTEGVSKQPILSYVWKDVNLTSISLVPSH